MTTRLAALASALFLTGLQIVSARGLDAQLNAIVDQPAFAHAQWGVLVCALDNGAVIYAHNPDLLLKPASNTKLYTAALALDRLGPTFHIKTSCYAAAPPDPNGVVHGDLIVYGRGDPSFSARFNDGDYSKAMLPLLDELARAGIKRVEGDLVGDDSYFSGPPYGASWTWEDLEDYDGAPASALTFQDNVIDLVFKPGADVGVPCQITTMPETTFEIFSNRTRTIAGEDGERFRTYTPLGGNVTYVWGAISTNAPRRTGAIPVSNPAAWFVSMLRDALAKRGVVVTGGTRSINWLDRQTTPFDPGKMVEVASVESAPLSEIVKTTLKLSENLYAQLLLLQVGAHASPGARDTQEAAMTEMRRFLTEAGVQRDTALVQEGSGLSRTGLVTPRATVRLLTFMSRHSAHREFMDALPVAGIDGTLRARLRGTSAAGNVRAKTGTLEYVNTLSGYVTNKAGANLVFSIMLNAYREEPGGPSGRGAIDELVRDLADSP